MVVLEAWLVIRLHVLVVVAAVTAHGTVVVLAFVRVKLLLVFDAVVFVVIEHFTAQELLRCSVDAVVNDSVHEIFLMGHPLSLTTKALLQDVFLWNVERLQILSVHDMLRPMFHQLDANASLDWDEVSVCYLLLLVVRP